LPSKEKSVFGVRADAKGKRKSYKRMPRETKRCREKGDQGAPCSREEGEEKAEQRAPASAGKAESGSILKAFLKDTGFNSQPRRHLRGEKSGQAFPGPRVNSWVAVKNHPG